MSGTTATKSEGFKNGILLNFTLQVYVKYIYSLQCQSEQTPNPIATGINADKYTFYLIDYDYIQPHRKLMFDLNPVLNQCCAKKTTLSLTSMTSL